jgi:hypothetical protein
MSKDLRSNYLFLKFIVCIIIVLFSTSSYAANVTASWNAPTTNEDGSSLTDLAGYKLYYGLASGNYTASIVVGNVTTYQINNLVDDLTYYFAVTALDKSGNESIYSEEQSFTLPPPPPPPAPDIAVSDSISPAGDLQIPFGDISEGNLAQQTVTVTNEGDANLVVGSIAQNNPLADPFSILNDSCSGQTISPSSNCTFQVHFSPSTSDTFNDSFDIPSNDPGENPVTVTISGNVLAVPVPDIRVGDSIGNPNDQQMPFGDVSAGNSSQHTVTLTNEGNANLVIGSIAQNNPLADPFHILNDSCSGQTISPSSNCTFKVNFLPSSSGYASDSFDIPSNDPDENPVTMNVTGNGTPPPTPDVSVTDSIGTADDLQMPFGNVTEGVLSDQTVTVTNSGNANLIIGNIAQSNPLSAPFSILSDYCSGKTIAPSSNCTLIVRFAPSTVGTLNDTFDIPSSDPDENPVTVSISGTGLSSVVNNPPDDPVLVYPAHGQRGLGKKVGFKWKKSKDPDGDLVTYDLQVCLDQSMTTGCVSEFNIALLENDNIYYAGNGSFGAGLVCLLIGPALIGAMRRLNRKAFLIIGIVLISGMLVVSCGGGGGGGSGGAVTSSSGGGSGVDDNISHDLSGLSSATTYYWTVTASDGSGGESTSEVRSFETE